MKISAHNPMRALRLLLVASFFIGCAVSKPAAQRDTGAQPAATPQPQQSKPWFADSLTSPIIDNSKYALQCIFKLNELGDDKVSGHIKYVESVSIRNTRTGEEARYQPVDIDKSLLTSQSYFANVWSPDDEYLLLPAGASDGFCIIKASGAVETVKRKRCDDFIRVLDYRPAMEVKEVAYYHEWGKWETNAAFSFKAGLYGDQEVFVYDIASKKLYDGVTRDKDYLTYLKERVGKNEIREVGENIRGRIEITDSFHKP